MASGVIIVSFVARQHQSGLDARNDNLRPHASYFQTRADEMRRVK